MGKGYGIEQWEIEEMSERLKGMDPLFDNHPAVVEQRKRTAEFVKGFQRANKEPCPGCDGHECDNGCAYPGALSNGER